MDLNKLVNDSLAKIQSEGIVEKAIDKRLTKTIEEIIDDLFREYGEFGKNLKEQIQFQLNINLQNLDIPSYNALVAMTVKEKLQQVVHINGVEKISQQIEGMLIGEMPRELKLSDLIEKMKEMENEDGDYNGREISLHVETPHSILTFIEFDPESGKSTYNCKYSISVDKHGCVSAVSVGNKELNKSKIMGGLYGFEEYMFKLYANNTKLIVDEDDVELEYGYSEDEY